jgi:hypothetical protein
MSEWQPPDEPLPSPEPPGVPDTEPGTPEPAPTEVPDEPDEGSPPTPPETRRFGIGVH